MYRVFDYTPDQVASVQLVVIVAAEAVVAAIAAGLFQAANSPALVAGLKLGLPVTVRGAEAVTVFLDLFASVAPGYPVLERSAAVVAVVVVAVVVVVVVVVVAAAATIQKKSRAISLN